MNTEKKHVFISYSRDDYKNKDNTVKQGNVISKIKKVFDAAHITYWIDEDGIYSGDEYVPIISKAIKMCDVFLFVSSQKSNASEWTSSEIAAARMYKKKIIPLRMDDSPYNDSIILYIAHLDYLDYRRNPKDALSTLVKSVQSYLEAQKEEEERRNAEIESQKRKKEEEQKRLIGEIELQAEELENDEREAELKRRRLLQSVQNVESESERNRLTELINSKGSIQRRYVQEIKELKEKSYELKSKKTALEKLVEKLTNRPPVVPKHQESHPFRNKLMIKIMGLVIGLILGFVAAAIMFPSFQQLQQKQDLIDSLEVKLEPILRAEREKEYERADSAYLKRNEKWRGMRLNSDTYREFYNHLENGDWDYFCEDGSVQPTNRVWIDIIALYKEVKDIESRNRVKISKSEIDETKQGLVRLDSITNMMKHEARFGEVDLNKYYHLIKELRSDRERFWELSKRGFW